MKHEKQKSARRHFIPTIQWRRGKVHGQVLYPTAWKLDFTGKTIRRHDSALPLFRVDGNLEGEWAIAVLRGTASLTDMLEALRAWKEASRHELLSVLKQADDAPPNLHDGLVVEHTSHVAGAAKRLRNIKENPFAYYARLGWITEPQRAAGEAYGRDLMLLSPRGRDSTDVDARGKGSSGQSGHSETEAMQDARKRLNAIHARLPPETRAIVTRVAEGHWATRAVALSLGKSPRDRGKKAFLDAMESLVAASDAARSCGWRVIKF